MAPGKDIRLDRKCLEALHIFGVPYTRLDFSQPVIKETLERKLIYVPADFTDGKYDFYVDSARLASSLEVRIVGKSLGLELENTCIDTLKREFIVGFDQDESIKIANLLGASVMPVELANYFLRLLYQGSKSKVGVYDENKNRLDSKFCERIFEDIISLNPIWRGEWLEEDFVMKEGELYGQRKKTLDSNKNIFVGDCYKLDEDVLREDKTPGISLIDWINNPTEHGFPKKDILKEQVFFWHPRVVGGVGLDAGSFSRVEFDCSSIRSYRDSYRGVRLVFLAKQ